MKRLLTLILFFTSLICLAQADTSLAGDVNTVANGIISILMHLGIEVPGWVGILVSIILILVRRWERRTMRKQHAAELKQTLASVPTMKEEHAGLFRRIIHRLEGKKKDTE